MLNLVTNALKFTLRGEVRVKVALENTEENSPVQEEREGEQFSTICSESKLMVQVQDTGIGISEKDQKSLFKLFGKIKDSNSLNP